MIDVPVITKRHISCPNCGSDYNVEHLFSNNATTFGPWPCSGADCQTVMNGLVRTDGSVSVEIKTEKRERDIVLFKFRDVYLVIGDCYHCAPPEDGDLPHQDYLYHSHHCFTNIVQGPLAVFDVDGSDPHGLLRYVSTIDDNEENRRRVEEDCVSLRELFEVFNTDGQPAPSNWPERNKGMLPWIAEMQREHKNKGDA